MNLRTTHYAPRTILLFILLLAFGLRAYHLDFQELRGDEAFGYFFSLRPFADIIQATLTLQEPHPVAGYFVQKIWLGWAGQTEFALRFVNVWFGTLAVALLYRLGRTLDIAAMSVALAAFLFAISPYAIWHSQDARMYSMSLALTLASVWLMATWLPRQRPPQAAAYVVVSWLALHTHYFSGFVLLAQNLFVLSRALIGRRMWLTLYAWLTLQTVLAVLYLPWLLRVNGILVNYGGNGDSPGLFEMWQRSFSVFAVGESVPAGQRTLWAGLAMLLLLIGAIELGRLGPPGRRSLWLLTCYLLTPLLITWISAAQRLIFNERYLIAAAPPFYLLLGLVWPVEHGGTRKDTAQRWLLRAIPMLLLLMMSTGMAFSLYHHYTNPIYSKTRGWRELSATVTRFSSGFAQGQVRIAQNFPDPTLWYYYQGVVDHLVLPPSPHAVDDARIQVIELAQAGVQRVILPVQTAPNWDDQAIATTALAAHYTLVFEQKVGGWPVQVYALAPPKVAGINVAFERGITLTDAAVQPLTLAPGGLISVHLAWQGSVQTLAGTEKAFVQLLDAAGQLVAQDDRPLAVNPALATYGILLPETLSAGDYRLIAGLYDPAQAGAPRLLTLDRGDFVLIEEIQVVSMAGR
ncbi:MAG: glycosyltransferase family 39 protein [Chloroflexota bacterium]|nr:glycosyltransferase family 39 protein [Chloroflexota bacterium]